MYLPYIVSSFISGFAIAWLIHFNRLRKEKRELKSTTGFLESERLKKETLQKTLASAHQQKMTLELELTQKIQATEKIINQLDSDILLMQKSYEETDALLKATQPEVHAIKLQLIEAQNTIVRLKALLAEKEKK